MVAPILVLERLIISPAEETAQHSQLCKIPKGTSTDSQAVIRSDHVFMKGKISQNVLVFAITKVGLQVLLPIASLKESASWCNFAGSSDKAKTNNAVYH